MSIASGLPKIQEKMSAGPLGRISSGFTYRKALQL
jgi:hypothetical protein